MKPLLLALLLVGGCGMMQPVQDHIEYLHTVFPNSRIVEHEDYSCVYVVTDTIECKTYIVNMDEFRRNMIDKIKE